MTTTMDIDAVTAETFADTVLAGAGATPVLVEFWARGCGPCRMLDPILREVATEFAGSLRVVKVDGDNELELVASSGVMGFPTLHLYHSGELAMRTVGVRSKARLMDDIRDAL